jgi:hypothetical protein
MAESGRSPHLARNAVLAALAVLGTTAAVTVTAVRPGAGEQVCPAGEDWVVAQPLGLAMAGYGRGTPDAPPLPDAATLPGTAAGATSPLVLAGCVDIDLLHPMPLTGDGRG